MEFYKDLEEAMKYFSSTGAFLTSGDGKMANSMTIAWGFMGFMWMKPYFITMVRPQRYTKEFIDKSGSFSISIPYGTLAEELKICGSKSGRDINKAEILKYAASKKISSPIVSGCDMYYECEVKYVDKLDKDYMPEQVIKTLYKDDFHHLYFGEIVEAYKI